MGRLAACGPVRGWVWLPWSVPGRAAHDVGIRGAQIGRFGHHDQGEKVFGQIVPIKGALHCGTDAIEVCHFLLSMVADFEEMKRPGDANNYNDNEPGVQKTERCECGNGH